MYLVQETIKMFYFSCYILHKILIDTHKYISLNLFLLYFVNLYRFMHFVLHQERVLHGAKECVQMLAD